MDQQPRLPLWFLFANWALVAAAFALGWFFGTRKFADLPDPQATALELVHAEILKSHVAPQDGKVLLDRAIKGMVAGLDPYSRYVPPSEVAADDEANSGRYEGIGALIVPHGDDVVVHWPFPGGPAAKAGLRPGDRLVAIDGTALASIPADRRRTAPSELVRGPSGTTVRLRVLREGAEVDVAVERGDLRQKSVKWAHFANPEAGLGYVYVRDFHPGVADELDRALEGLSAQRPLRGLVLDLRFDGGGSLTDCITIANRFLREGTIVSQRRRDREIVETSTARAEQCRFPELPLVLLVNGGSASASEVLAGALQDHGRAAVVGERTFGKGFVNTRYSWKEFRLKLTTAFFYTPNGRNIDRNYKPNGDAADPEAGGISPDVAAAVDDVVRERIRAVLDEHEPPAEYLAAFAEVAAKYELSVPAPPRAGDDPQLTQALAALRDRVAAAQEPKTR